MPWVKIDDHFDEHPKVAAIGPLGVALQVAGLCYCNRNLTDGFIPRSVARTLVDFDGLAFVGPVSEIGIGSGEDVQAKHVIDRLVAAGVWEDTPGGYQVHNYAIYQPTRAEVEAERQQKQNAGHLGGVATAQARAQARATASAKQTPKQNASGRSSTRRSTRSSRTPAEAQAESKPVPVPEPPVGEGEGTGTGGGSRGEATHPHPQAAASPSPPSPRGDAGSAATPDSDPAPRRREPGLCEHGRDPAQCWRCAPPGAPPPPELAALREQLRHPPAPPPSTVEEAP